MVGFTGQGASSAGSEGFGPRLSITGCDVHLDLPFACFITALTIGVCVETVARVLGLWRYRSPVFPLINILLVFGLIEGLSVGWFVGGRDALRGVFPVLFMAGAVLGILIEGLNEFWIHAWSWSDRPILGVRRSIDKAAFVGVTWGFVPLLTVLLARLLMTVSLEA